MLKELSLTYAHCPPSYDANARCDYHMGEAGNTIDNCKAFKYRVQGLTNSKAVIFTPTCSNVKTNPMPTNMGPSASVVEDAIN